MLALVTLAGCATAANNATPPTAASSGATTTPAAPTTTTSPAEATVTAQLPVVRCPTTEAVAAPTATTQPLPATVTVRVPAAVTAPLAAYGDSAGIMVLVGPQGWSCTAGYGADGSGGVIAYPPGEAVPASWGAGWHLPAASPVEAVAGSETSACVDCTLGQTCPLFTAAAAAYKASLGRACAARPHAESALPFNDGVVAFEDGPGVAGDGIPSGGRDPANGVMTYHPGSPDGSWLETCTLPQGDHLECSTVLDAFVASYGAR